MPKSKNAADKLDRRSCIGLLGACVGTSLLVPIKTARALQPATQTSFDITQPPFNADQTGNLDATAGIQAALNEISSIGGGKLIVPAGNYRLTGPLVCRSSITITGDGQESSVFVIQHSGTAFTISCPSYYCSVAVRDVGFSPCPSGGGAAGTALLVSFPPGNSGWQGCAIDNVDFGAARPGYTVFTTGVVFNNVFRGNIRNTNMHSNVGSVSGTSFVTLTGKCVDNRLNNCSVDGIDVGVFVASYAEGLHISDCVIIGNHAISTGSQPYSGDGQSTPLINLLGLYVSGCEFNCTGWAANLGYVCTGWISDTHFDCETPWVGSVQLQGCTKVHIRSCSMAGGATTSNAAFYLGVLTWGTPTWSTNEISISDIDFINTNVGVLFSANTMNSSAFGLKLLAPGEGQLVSVNTQIGAAWFGPYVDWSNNLTNTAQWVSSSIGVSPASPKIRSSNP